MDTDEIIQRCDYLAISETWMREDEEPIQIQHYQCISHSNSRSSSTTNAAGEVAIYRHLNAISNCTKMDNDFSNLSQVSRLFGDICIFEITAATVESNFKFIFGLIYIHPRTSCKNVSMLMYQSLLPYVYNRQYVPPFLTLDDKIPIVLCGDFNIDVMNDRFFLNFVKDTFNLDCVVKRNLPGPYFYQAHYV